MKNGKYIILIVLVLFALSLCGCSLQGTKQSEESSDEKSSTQEDVKFDATGISASWRSIDLFKINKAASNLSWAAAVKMAIVADDPNTKYKCWQGDLSETLYGDRNKKACNYDLFNYDMERVCLSMKWRVIFTLKDMGVASKSRIANSLITGRPVIITRREKNNHDSYWAVVIYGINSNTNEIKVWDPEHGWNYTCDYTGFAADSRYDQLSLSFY